MNANDTIKVMIIQFTKYGFFGPIFATHFYVNGKRMSHNSFGQLRGLLYDNYTSTKSQEWHDKNKDGIDRYYNVIYYKPKNFHRLSTGI